MQLLCAGLRALGREVWIHKPVACGDWDEGMADDGRTLIPLADPKQNPDEICPLQFKAACSPHIAAGLENQETSWQAMAEKITALKGEHDLLIEGAGGILAPLSTDGGTIIDICLAQKLPCLLVTRPHLGTLNHTQLTVNEAQRCGLKILGLVINYHDADIDLNDVAIQTARQELEKLCQIPVLGEVPFDSDTNNNCAKALAESLIQAHAG